MKARNSNIIDLNFRKKASGLPILSKVNIDEYAEALVSDFKPELLKKPGPMPIDEFIELYLNLTVDYQNLSLDGKTLGMIVFNDGYVEVYDDQKNKKILEVEAGTIFIDNALIADDNQIGRCRFTFAHEPGHWIFHRHMYTVNKNEMFLFDVRYTAQKKCDMYSLKDVDLSVKRDYFKTDEDWQEWQADYFASALLMPQKIVKELFSSFLSSQVEPPQKKINSNGRIDQYIRTMAAIFQVSYSAMKIRLRNLGFLNNGIFCLLMSWCDN